MTVAEKQLEICADVAIPLPIPGPFTYFIPSEFREKAVPGVRVQVPFKNQETVGYVVALREAAVDSKFKSILQVLDDNPVLNPVLLSLTRWIADYYCASWGETIENALPKWVKFGKKAEKALEKSKNAPLHNLPDAIELKLTVEQSAAFNRILSALEKQNPKPILIHGVTGSGKSEIYIRSIKEVLKKGKSAICLVPEIALTEQIRRFFYQHFGNDLEILHSKLNDGERFLAWNRLQTGKKKVILGPRSAIFAPVQNLGLIIMDEEHEGSYKQETAPRYHAREVAAFRAEQEKALFLMGTATPSLESMYKAQKGIFDLITLSSRVDNKIMPKVQIFDLKEAREGKKTAIISQRMYFEIEQNLHKKEGTMLLLNRRGFSTSITCPQCGQIETCISCQVSLTFHQEDEMLLCHYCNYQKPVPPECPNCKSPLLKYKGFGTEKIESEVAARFPAARISRLDADTVRKKGSHEIILKDFRDQKIDILIGTQMIAKGFDFPHVTLVGVILADVGLMLPDFRSSERTFQLLTQVAGRAGRGNIEGRVLIQTFSPHHPSIQHARTHDYARFYDYELQQRYTYNYPPYSRLVNIIVRSHDEKKVYLHAREIREAISLAVKECTEMGEKIDLSGPAPLPFYRLRGHFRWHVMIKAPAESSIFSKIHKAAASVKKLAGVQIAIDIDPLNIL